MKTFIQNKSGFTLIEILVSLGVIGVLIVMATTIFITTIQNSKKAETINEARQNAALVIDTLQRDVRKASGVEVFNGGASVSIGIPGDQLTVGTIDWFCRDPVPATVNNFIERDVHTMTNLDTITGVNIVNCSFTQLSANAATLSFDVTEGVGVTGASDEYQVNIHFETTVTTRNY